MHHHTTPRRVLARLRRVPPVVVGLVVAGLLLSAGATVAAWQATATASLGSASITTGELKINSVDPGTWSRSGGSTQTVFDSSNPALHEGETLTYTTNVNVTAIGKNLKATLELTGGATIPPAVRDYVTVTMTPVKFEGTPGQQPVTITVTVEAKAGMQGSVDQIDLTNLQLHLTNGANWQDTATLNAGTLALGSTTVDGDYVATYDLSKDTGGSDGAGDNTIALYLTKPGDGTTIFWGDGSTTVWSSSGESWANSYPTDGDIRTTSTVTSSSGTTWKLEHKYVSEPTEPVKVVIKGTFEGIGSETQTKADAGALISVDKWSASTGTTSAAYAYLNAVNAFPDDTTRFPAPPTSVTDMTGMFQNAESMYAVSWGWDTRNVENMSHMFYGATKFASMESIAAWNTAKVTNMSYMFADTKAFNGNLTTWNTGEVTNMSHMFNGASEYSGYFTIGPWDVSKVTDMASMFESAAKFNSPIGSWKTGNVRTMNSMFKGAKWFAQDLSCWDVMRVTPDGYQNFDPGPPNPAGFRAPAHWGQELPASCKIDLGSGPMVLRVDPSASKTTALYLSGVEGATIDWGEGEGPVAAKDGKNEHTYSDREDWAWNWATVKIDGKIEGFGSPDQSVDDVKSLKQVTSWGGTGITSGAYAFKNTANLVGVAEIPDSMTDVSGMFADCTSNMPAFYIGWWDTSHVKNMRAMFQGAVYFRDNLPNWNTSRVTDMSFMFDGATAFNGYVREFDTSQVTTMKAMFRNTPFNQEVFNAEWRQDQYWNTSNVRDMSSMFEGAAKFNQDISTWKVDNVKDMSQMFEGATAFNQNLNTWKVHNVTDMSSMFQGATAFTAFDGNLNQWWPGNVENMSHMFDGASLSEENGGIGYWTVSKVTDFSYMFANSDFNGYNLERWKINDTTTVNMSHMFYNARKFNQPLQNVTVGEAERTWDVSHVTDMSSMFEGAAVMKYDLSSWDVGAVKKPEPLPASRWAYFAAGSGLTEAEVPKFWPCAWPGDSAVEGLGCGVDSSEESTEGEQPASEGSELDQTPAPETTESAQAPADPSSPEPSSEPTTPESAEASTPAPEPTATPEPTSTPDPMPSPEPTQAPTQTPSPSSSATAVPPTQPSTEPSDTSVPTAPATVGARTEGEDDA